MGWNLDTIGRYNSHIWSYEIDGCLLNLLIMNDHKFKPGNQKYQEFTQDHP